jgi:hypothetical protein
MSKRLKNASEGVHEQPRTFPGVHGLQGVQGLAATDQHACYQFSLFTHTSNPNQAIYSLEVREDLMF